MKRKMTKAEVLKDKEETCMKPKRANRPTVQSVVGCSHKHVNGICLGVAFCCDCGRVFIDRNDGTVKTCRAGGYTSNLKLANKIQEHVRLKY
jgi:hypothetical protein